MKLTHDTADWSYCIPIICKLIFNTFEPGPFHFGKASRFINLWAVVWTAFVSVIFLSPTQMPATPENMNYAVVILFAVFLFATSYWYIAGNKYYTGPRTRAHVVGGDIVADDSSDGAIEDQEKKAGASPVLEKDGLAAQRAPAELNG